MRIIEENRLYEFDTLNKNSVINKIRKFQVLCNELSIKDSEGKTLAENNILGWRTKSCINKLPELKIGSKGKAVEFVQQVLKANTIDGNFGPITRQCVIEYQRDKNLQSDGIVGIQTWKALIET